MKWYPRWIGDYARATARLSVTDHGVFALLLDEQYATEEGLPADLTALFRLTRASTKTERLSVKKVVGLHFPLKEDGLRWNKRAAEEIGKAKAAKNKASEAGRRGAERRWGIGDPIPKDGHPIRKNGVPHVAPHAPSHANQDGSPDPDTRGKSKNPQPPRGQTRGTAASRRKPRTETDRSLAAWRTLHVGTKQVQESGKTWAALHDILGDPIAYAVGESMGFKRIAEASDFNIKRIREEFREKYERRATPAANIDTPKSPEARQ